MCTDKIDTKVDFDDIPDLNDDQYQNMLEVKTAEMKSFKKWMDINFNQQFRSTLAQFIVGIVSGALAFSKGMMIGLPILAIGSLHNAHSDEYISLNDDEASWLGSLMFLFQPCSSVVGGFLQPYIGCKCGLILALVPQIISWICMSVAKSVQVLYLSVILFGISDGSMESAKVSHLGEISEPRLRGLLTCVSFITFGLGLIFELFLGSFFSWRKTAAMSTILPAIGIIFISLIPESPIWLLNKGKKKAALKSLCWLRGWVKEDTVKAEFEEMRRYVETSRIFLRDRINSDDISETKFLKSGWKNFTSSLRRPNMWKPFLLLTVCTFSNHSVSLSGMRSYLLEILGALRVIMDPSWFLFISRLLSICGGIICFSVVKFSGKRKLILFSLLMCSLTCILLGSYLSFSNDNDMPWISSTSIWTLHLILAVGIEPIPCMLKSEIFSTSDRSLGAGLSAALHYVVGFIFSKTFYSFKEMLQLSGCFIMYGVVGLIGFIYLFLYLPETEGKTLAEVEQYFTNELKDPNVNTKFS